MMLRRRMLGRKTDPKTVTHTVCEPARSKCTCTCHKSHFVRDSTGKMPQASWSTLIKHRPLHSPWEPSLSTHCLGNRHDWWGMVTQESKPLRSHMFFCLDRHDSK